MLNSSDPQASVAPPAAPARGLDPRQLALGLGAGVLAGLIDLGVILSLAALIFSGQLAGFVANGIGLLLVGAGVMNIALALLSTRPAIIGGVQDAPAVVVALIAASVAAQMPAGSDAAATYATVVVAIALTTLITGAAFVLLGQLRLGSLVRYLPYPVIGGFLAGTGWLLTLGGVSIMADVPSEFGELQRMFQPPTLWQWLPGLIFGFVILLALRRSQHILVLPGLLLAAIVLFYGWLALWGIPLAQAQDRGWLLGLFPGEVLWSPPTPAMLGMVQWSAIGWPAQRYRRGGDHQRDRPAAERERPSACAPQRHRPEPGAARGGHRTACGRAGRQPARLPRAQPIDDRAAYGREHPAGGDRGGPDELRGLFRGRRDPLADTACRAGRHGLLPRAGLPR